MGPIYINMYRFTILATYSYLVTHRKKLRKCKFKRFMYVLCLGRFIRRETIMHVYKHTHIFYIITEVEKG